MRMKNFRTVLLFFICVVSGDFELMALENMNFMCPVMTDEKSETKYKTLHQEKNVYFCCKKCLKKFQKNPERYQDNISYTTTDVHDEIKESYHGDHAHNEEGHSHDHSKDHGSGGNWLSPLFGKLHPIVIHFPIAGVFFAFLLQMASFLFKDKELRFAVGFLLILSCLSILMAGITGWSNASSRTFSGEEIELVFRHRWLGIVSSVLVLLTTVLHFKHKEEKGRVFGGYMLLLIISVALVSLTGHFGGTLVYGTDYFKF